MTPERWQQVEAIFQTALDLGPDERDRYLAEACAQDHTLKVDVQNLLSQHESAGNLLEEPLFGETELNELGSLEGLTDPEDSDPMLGRRLGSYQIEREIGRGGMGAVYEALRADKEFQMRVAIKLVKRGMDTDFILRRFRTERQILAALEHPHIARLLDGGTTDDGLPYFVMEYIEGQPLYNYCDANQLTISERLKLFMSICDALHYAHQKQVVHRDIKPSNVLVTSEGVPKLLDFGIAKLLDPGLVGDITHDPTATAMRLMTPEYASPEQVQGAPTSPTTDVYSLGVLLYELLTGHRPYRLSNRAPHEMARVICEEPPAPPSFIITRHEDLLPKFMSLGDEATTLKTLYTTRNATGESLRRDLSGALDSIVMRALRKEPEWRYQTAELLRDDIGRYLSGVPISVLPDSPFSPPGRKSQPIMTENALAVLPLKLLDIQHGPDTGPDYLGTGLADALITRLSAVRRFAVRPTNSVLRYGADSDPIAAGRELGVAFVLDGRVRRADDRIRVTIQLLSVMDGTALWAGQFDEKFTDVLSLEDAISSNVAEAIIPHLTGDERVRLGKRGTNNAQAHEAYLRGRFYWNMFTEDGFARAIVCYHQAIALDPNYALAYAGIASYYNWLGSFTVLPFAECSAAAYEAASKAVALDPTLAEGYSTAGQAILCRDFAWSSAERQLLHAIELNPNYSSARIYYALQLGMEGRFSDSIHEAELARELDPLAIISRFTVVWCLYHAKRFDEAWEACKETLEREPNNLMMLYASSFLLSRMERHDEAIANAQRNVELMGKASNTMGRLGAANALAGNVAAAEAILAEMAAISSRRHMSPYHMALINCGLGRIEESLDLLEKAYDIRDAKILWMAVDPELDALHGHPRFNDLLRKLNHRLALPTLPARSLSGEESIAVLPFKISSPVENTGDEYLGIGLTDTLITRLSSVQRLIVRPTSSVLRYRGAGIDPLLAGRDLSVNFIVEGTLVRDGDRLRVHAQLLRVRDGEVRWSEEFDEDSTDVLQIEDSISEQVANALLPQLTRDEQQQLSKRGTDVAQAFESYLRGRYYWNSYTESGLAKALECYNHAIELDPEYALAYTGIADYYNWLGVFGVRPFIETSAGAKAAATKAVELDPSSAEAYSALGFATVCHDFDWAVAEGQHRLAINLNPNYATGHNWFGFHLLMIGRFDDSIREMQRARELDPLSPSIMQSLGWAYYQARRFDEALETFEKMVAMAPEMAYGLATYSWALRHVGKTLQAVEIGEKSLQLSSGGQFHVGVVGAAYAAAGRKTEAQAALQRLNDMSRTGYVSPYHRALIHVHLGEHEKTIALLQDCWSIREGWLAWLAVEPQFDPIRKDPRFLDILSKTKNPAGLGLAATARASAAAQAQPSYERTSVTSPVPSPAPQMLDSANEEARGLYTAGRYYATRRTAEGMRQAIERLKRAVELDPRFALAHAELADCYALLNWYVEPPPPGAWELAKESALRAVEADPQLAEGHASLGFVRLHHDRDWDDAERELRQAIMLKPGIQVAHRWFAFSLSAMGRHEEAFAEMERARQISPQSPVLATAVANVLFLAGKYDEAIEQSRKALDLDSGAVSAHTVLRWAYEKKGMQQEALATFEQERIFAGDTPTTHAKRAHVLASIGRRDEACAILEDILANRSEKWVSAYEIAIIYCLTGDFDNSFRWLAQAEREHAVGFTFVRVDPRLEALRADPRFAALLTGLDRTIP